MKANFTVLGFLILLFYEADLVLSLLRYLNQKEGTPYQRNDSDLAFISHCVYDNAKDLTCYYEAIPSVGRPVRLMHTFPGSKRFYGCVQPSNFSCTWPGDGQENGTAPKSHLTYYLFVVNSSSVPITEWVVMKPLDELKPSKVRNVSSSCTNTSLTVSWEPPKLFLTVHNLVYRYRVRLFQKRTQIEERDNVIGLSTTFLGLVPYENYTVKISAKNNTDTGYWSEPYHLTNRTLPGLAIVNPEKVVYHFLNGANVEIIWKPLALSQSRGPNLTYEVVIASNAGQLLKKRKDIIGSKVTLEVESSSPKVVKLFASHSYGRSTTIPPTILEIPWPKPDAISEVSAVVDEDNSVEFYWTLDSNVTTYNLLWCKTSYSRQMCTSGFEWMPISSTDVGVPMQLNISHGLLYNFAISANYEDYKQGSLTWSTCNFVKGKAIKKPRKPYKSAVMKAEELHVEWNLPSCGETGYIRSYIVHYCLSSDCENSEKQEQVSSVTNKFQTSSVEVEAYEVWIEARSADDLAPTAESDRLVVSVYSNSLSGGAIAAIVICILFVIGLVIFVVYHWKRKVQKKLKHLEITVPERQKVGKLDLDDPVSYNYSAETQEIYRPESRNSDNISNARREGFESRGSENLRNEFRELFVNAA